jgi:hypothetical protein
MGLGCLLHQKPTCLELWWVSYGLYTRVRQGVARVGCHVTRVHVLGLILGSTDCWHPRLGMAALGPVFDWVLVNHVAFRVD